MDIVSKMITFVNEQAEFHEKMAERFSSDPKRADKHKTTGAAFRELASDIAALSEQAHTPKTELSAKTVQSLYLSLEEVSGLPDELLKELGISDGEDYAILRIVDDCGGVASIDRILLGLFHKTKEIVKRQALTSRLYRMAQKGLIYSVPDRKGVYSIKDLSSEEASELLGN